jgi:hypothetical protein
LCPGYGEKSGMGWPMHYRYPPLFLFLAAPFIVFSLPWAAGIFTALKCGAFFLLIRALWKRLGPSPGAVAWLVPLLLAGPYVVEDLRYGNAQGFIFALTGAALLLVTSAPLLAAFALALAISIKAWPLFFIPYLAARRQWKVAGWTLALTGGLLLLPSLYFGLGSNLDLLAQWARQEFSTQTGSAEIWFPSQSLRGVLMRYLTVIDYTQVPDSNYPLIHVAELDPDVVRVLWYRRASIRSGRCTGIHNARAAAAVLSEVHAGSLALAGDGCGSRGGKKQSSWIALCGRRCGDHSAVYKWSGGPAAGAGPRFRFPGNSPVGRLPYSFDF